MNGDLRAHLYPYGVGSHGSLFRIVLCFYYVLLISRFPAFIFNGYWCFGGEVSAFSPLFIYVTEASWTPFTINLIPCTSRLNPLIRSSIKNIRCFVRFETAYMGLLRIVFSGIILTHIGLGSPVILIRASPIFNHVILSFSSSLSFMYLATVSI